MNKINGTKTSGKENVSGHICSGCGLCSTICPTNSIQIEANLFGEFKPAINDECCNCGRCTQICPFESNELNYKFENLSNSHNKYIGYYDEIFQGYSTKHQKTSTSGGLNTWLLEELLDKKEVDAVVCVGESIKNNEFFEYKIINNKEELLKCARTAYYPCEISTVIKQIKKSKQKVAIVCLPCVAKGLRLAMKKDEKLNKQVKYILGIVCSYLPTRAMTEFIINKGGYKLEDIKSIKFREKKYGDHYGILIETKNNEEKYLSPCEWDIKTTFLKKHFTHLSCLCCDDIFAEYADITFMDAWLEEYKDDSKGYSIAISRNKYLSEIINNGKEPIFKVDYTKPIIAQKYGKLLEFKRRGIGPRIKKMRNLGYKIKDKRNEKISYFEYLAEYIEITRILKINNYVRGIWNDKNKEIDADKLTKVIKRKSLIFDIIRKVLRIPQRYLVKN